MAHVRITNISDDILTLPLPLKGALAQGGSGVTSLPIAKLYDMFNDNPFGATVVELTEVPDSVPVTVGIEGPFDFGGYQIKNLGTPTDPTDAATKAYVDGSGGGGGISELTGDVTAVGPGVVPATVVALQGNAVSSVAPSDGQVLTWNGSAWVPGAPASGGSGGGGQTYFFNYGTAGQGPVPAVGDKQLGLVAEVPLSTITSPVLPNDGTSFVVVAGFVTDLNAPGLTTIPAGIWDFNIWAQAAGPSLNPNDVKARTRVYKWDGATTTLLATGSVIPLYDPSQTIQYISSALIPQTNVLSTDRLYVTLEAVSVSNNHTIKFSFGDASPSHVHTTLPSVAGTGLVHVINGVMQSPASPVDLTAGATEISGTLPIGNGGTGLATTPTDGQLLIGTTATNDYTLATLTAGTNVSITNGAGSVTIDAVGSIAGTIAANEIAFGTGVDTVGGDARLTWNPTTPVLAVDVPVGTPAFVVQDTGVLVYAKVEPGAFRQESGFDKATLSAVGSVELRLDADTAGAGYIPTISAYDETSTPHKLDLVLGELRVNGAPGAAGEVLTSNGPGAAPTWQAGGGGGTIAGTIAANEVAFGTAPDTIGGSASLTYNPSTQDLTVGDGTPHSIRIGPYGYVANPIIESLNSMNINVVNFGGALGIQAANVDLVLIGGDDGGGESYLQTQAGVRLEVQARATIRPAVDNANALTVRTAADAEVLGVDTTVPAVRLASELQSGGGSGAAGEVLTSNGPGVAPTWQAGGGGGGATEITDTYFVDAVLGDDLTADGSISKPYATIQACLTAIGNPTSKQDACRKITVCIAPAHSSAPGIIASQANNFDGVYQENLWVPSRQITFVGPGVKIGNAGDASGFGNITQEISTARRFGASSSELRHTMSFIGRENSRDTHNRVRNGIHVGGITRISIIQRNIASIQGDAVGGTRVTVTLAGGQNPYGVAVSPYAQLAVTLTDAGDVFGYTSPTGVAIANSTTANQMVFVKSLAGGASGPALDTYYYVVNATLTTFQLSTSIGGAPIAITANGTGVIMAKPGYAPFEDLVRIKVAGTTNYGTTATPVAYDIIERIDDVTFIARRVTGTNTSAAAELAVGTITETDSTGSSTSVTHDILFDCCYQQGAVINDDGAVYSAAATAGSLVIYAKDSRFNGGFLAGSATVQRWENSQAVTTVNAGATITSFSRATNVVTVNTSTTCQWATGQVVTIANSTSGAQNIDGTWVITTGGTNTFKLSQTGADYGSQTPSGSSTITAMSVWSTIVTMAQASFSGAGIMLGATPFTLGSDDNAVTNTRFGVTRIYTSSTSALPLARFDAYTASWMYAGGAYFSFPVTFTDAGDIVTKTAHGLSNGSVVRFSGIVNTTGISVNTDYYVVGATATTFQLALTPGGAAIALTTNGTGTMDVLPLYYSAFLDTYVPTQLFTGNTWVQTSSVTVANTTTETNLTGAGVGALNLPANFLKLGRNLRISGAGVFSCTAATPTLRLQIKLGATVIADSTAITLPVAETNKGFTFDVNVAVRTTGATGTVFSNGQVTRMATTLAAEPFNVLSAGVPAAVTVNTTTSQLLTVTATWSAADANNSITVTNLVVTA